MKETVSCTKRAAGHGSENIPQKNRESRLLIPQPDESINSGKDTKTWCSYMEKGFRESRNLQVHETGSTTSAPETLNTDKN